MEASDIKSGTVFNFSSTQLGIIRGYDNRGENFTTHNDIAKIVIREKYSNNPTMFFHADYLTASGNVINVVVGIHYLAELQKNTQQ
jgi:hypothetical protein